MELKNPSEMKAYTFWQFISYVWYIIALGITCWLFGFGNTTYIRYWYIVATFIFIAFRIPDYLGSEYYYFSSEYCFLITLFMSITLITEVEIWRLIPYVHGAMLIYSIKLRDAFVPHDPIRTTTFAIHSLSSVVLYRLYWWDENIIPVTIANLTLNLFTERIKFVCITCFLSLIPHTVYLYREPYSLWNKIKSSSALLFSTAMMLGFGMMMMYSFILATIVVVIQVLSGLYCGGRYYIDRSKGLVAKSRDGKSEESQELSGHYVFIYGLTIITYAITCWILGRNDHMLLRIWYAIVILVYIGLRIQNYVEMKRYHFFAEICYYINLITVYIVLTGIDIRTIYPFIHGCMLLFGIVSADMIILHDIPRTTSFIIHGFTAVITRRLYWHGDEALLLDWSDLTFESFLTRWIVCISYYIIWFIPYSIYLLRYNGKSINMFSYRMRNKPKTILNKLNYLITRHLFGSACALAIGIILMHSWHLNTLIVVVNVLVGLISGSRFYQIKSRNVIKITNKDSVINT